MPRILSGVQPSGLQHLGNYFGAIREHVRLQEEGEAFYFIADLHALTTVHDAAKLREWVRELAVTYLALGLDPERSALFRQSDVPEVTEISWILSTASGMGLLERAHSYKDKISRGIKPSVGLFTYPILMAADILAYDADLVPVGQDQIQHVEMTQDMAGYVNGRYQEEVFRRPEWRLSATPRVVGIDGQKMSKSYGNHLWIFEEGKRLKKAVGRITTDSRPPEEPKDPEGVLLFDWLELLLPRADYEKLRERAHAGGPEGPGYGELKACIIAAVDTHFAEAREERRRLMADPARVDAVLAEGARRARAAAIQVRDRAYRACGLR